MELDAILESFQVEPEEIDEIRDAFSLRRYRSDEVMFRESEPSDNFYAIKSGEVLVLKRNQSGDDEPLAVLKEGQFFGEIGLLEKMSRTATVKALVDLEVFELTEERFQQLVNHSAAFSSVLDRVSKIRLLGQTPIFRELDESSLLAVQGLLVEQTYPEGTTVFNQNDAPDAMFIIVKGGARVSRETNGGRPVTLAHLGTGDCFGEMGVIEAQPRSATVVTTEPSTLLVLPRDGFQRFLKEDPRVSFGMLKVLSRRLRDEDKEVALEKSTSFFKGMTIVCRPERCLSCKACEIACAVSKSRTRSLYSAIREEPLPVRRIHVRRSQTGPEAVARPEHCLHCRDAPCLTSCKFGAIKRDVASGTIVISEDKCKGCGLCAKACPFEVVTVVRSQGKKRVALKCTYCAENRGGPACVRSCPTNALAISLAWTPV